MAPHRRGRTTLSQGLDREVHQVIRKIQDDRTQYGDTDFRFTFASVYDEIKRSNSSLNRRPKKILEDSVERVLSVLQQDAAETDSDDVDIDDIGSPGATRPASNGLNKSIVAMWSKGTSTPAQGQALNETNTKSQVNGEPARKKRKRAGPSIDYSPPSHVSLDSLGGVDSIIQQFSDLLFIPLMVPAAYANSEMQPIRGILVHGPPGCGKTTICNAIAAEFGVNFISVSAPSVVSGMSGESEKQLREYFDEAKKAAPCLLFFDEIDAITPKRDSAQREMEKRIVAQLSTCMDDLDPSTNDGKPVIVLAATNRPDSLDPSLRRGGRFDKEINMSVPNEAMREQILKALTRKTPLSSDVDLALLAIKTPGFVGADLKDLILTACNIAMQRYQDELRRDLQSTEASSDTQPTDQPTAMSTLRQMISHARAHPPPPHLITLTQQDLLLSLPRISPSALREGFATVPNVSFSSIGALQPLITELHQTLIQPILRPDLFQSLGLSPSSGSLLWGPPGCGKTLLAKATASSSHANFISVKGPELLNKYLGESERSIRTVFARARASVPVIIFFDELDALVPRRDSAADGPASRVVNTLLAELDGLGASRAGIYVVAATNRPDIIDPAMLRPGRLETMLYVGLPDPAGRVDILRTITKSIPNFAFTPEIEAVARACDGFSGADLESLKRRAGYAAVKRRAGASPGANADAGTLDQTPDVNMSGCAAQQAQPFTLTAADFVVAKDEVRRSVSESDVKRYENLRREWERT